MLALKPMKFMLSTVIALTVLSCSQAREDEFGTNETIGDKPKRKDWKHQYAGKYDILMLDEKAAPPNCDYFVLDSNGTALWIWQGQGKAGKWFADSSVITTYINGNSGAIREDFILSEKFTNGNPVFANGSHWLKPRER
jgi:hypothetical protein